MDLFFKEDVTIHFSFENKNTPVWRLENWNKAGLSMFNGTIYVVVTPYDSVGYVQIPDGRSS